MEAFEFAKTASMKVPDLTGIKGFNQRGGEVVSQLPHKQKIEGSSPSPANYFAPQASIIRVGGDVAIKVIAQTSIRDEAVLEELREKCETLVTQMEIHLKTVEDHKLSEEKKDEQQEQLHHD